MHSSGIIFKAPIAFLLIFLSACQKKPSAAFAPGKPEYTAGQTIELVNLSTKGRTYKWTFPDGTTATSENASYPTLASPTGYNLQFKLEAFSKNGKKSGNAVQDIYLNPSKGKCVIYTKSTPAYTCNLFIDGASRGNITVYPSSSVPECGENKFPNYELPIGKHALTFVFISGIYTSTANAQVNIEWNGCSAVKLD